MGKWLALVENPNISNDCAAEPTEPRNAMHKQSFVGFVASLPERFQESKSGGKDLAKAEIPPASADELMSQLLEAAMHACDFWGDSQAARAEMIADVKATPQHLRQDLLEHFLSAYGKAK
jgi:hypothetical protein